MTPQLLAQHEARVVSWPGMNEEAIASHEITSRTYSYLPHSRLVCLAECSAGAGDRNSESTGHYHLLPGTPGGDDHLMCCCCGHDPWMGFRRRYMYGRWRVVTFLVPSSMYMYL